MYFSMFLGPRVFGPQGDLVTIDASLEQALEADEAGFTAIYVGEQHHNDYEPYSDPFTIGGYLAAQLKQAWIGTSVVPLVLNHPLRLIERMNLLDLLMRGRVMYGVSSGQPNNGTAFGIHKMGAEYRARLFEQRLELLLRAWAHRPEDGPLEFVTEAEQGTMDGRVMPYSYRVPHPLFAVGTNTEAKVADAGRRGFYLHLGPTDFDRLRHLAGVYRSALAEGGLDESSIEDRMRWMIHTRWIIVGETDDEAWESAQRQFGPAVNFIPWLTKDEQYAGKSVRELHDMDPGSFAPSFGMPESPAAWTQRCHIVGSPETVAETLRSFAEVGVPHIHARWIMSNAGIEAGRRSFRLFVEEVMPRVGIDRMPDLRPDEIRPEFRDPALAPSWTSPIPVASANGGPGGSTMSIDGEWRITIETPMGPQVATLQLTRNGEELTGSQSGNGETVTIYDGASTVDEAEWKVDVTQPFPLTIAFSAKVDGDSISGQAQAGAFPPSPFTGARQ
jgi:alkanesulfonate monooxygenase SsuD/methylene tetrahydromethanopterin reductase-like flavin-dependent oxidoreductase (luciferase family)